GNDLLLLRRPHQPLDRLLRIGPQTDDQTLAHKYLSCHSRPHPGDGRERSLWLLSNTDSERVRPSAVTHTCLLFGATAEAAQHHQLVVLATHEDTLQPGPGITDFGDQFGFEIAALDVQRRIQP